MIKSKNNKFYSIGSKGKYKILRERDKWTYINDESSIQVCRLQESLQSAVNYINTNLNLAEEWSQTTLRNWIG